MMNLEYVRGLRDHFATLKPEQIDQSQGLYIPCWYAEPCGCFGLHSAIFNDSTEYDPKMVGIFFSHVSGVRDNNHNGLTEKILQKAYRNIVGSDDLFLPYWRFSWGVPIVDVLDEVIRMHSE